MFYWYFRCLATAVQQDHPRGGLYAPLALVFVVVNAGSELRAQVVLVSRFFVPAHDPPQSVYSSTWFTL